MYAARTLTAFFEKKTTVAIIGTASKKAKRKSLIMKSRMLISQAFIIPSMPISVFSEGFNFFASKRCFICKRCRRGEIKRIESSRVIAGKMTVR